MHAVRLGVPLVVPLGVALAVVLLLCAAAPAAAHADLLRAEPAQNTRVDDVPSHLALWFSERVEPASIRIEVLDRDGTDHVVAVTLDSSTRSRVDVGVAPLEPGLYSVSWRVVSAVDGHRTSGGYLLGVAVDIPADAELPGSDEVAEVRFWETIARAVAFGGASLLAGIPATILYRRRRGAIPRWWSRHAPPGPQLQDARLMRIAGWAGIAAATAVVLLLAGLGVRLEVGLIESARTTGHGRMLAYRVALLLVAAALAFAAARAARLAAWASAALFVALGAFVATSLSGHAGSAAGSTAIIVTMDALHQIAAAAWIGGVFVLVLTLWRIEDARTAGVLVRDFSPFAVAAVIVLVLTGVYGSAAHREALFMPPGSAWDWALGVKILLLIPLVALGAWNRYRLQPRLLAGQRQPSLRRVRRSTAAEVVLMVFVLVATGALTHATPPALLQDPTGPLPGQVAEHRTEGDDVFRVVMHPFPVTLGVQNLTVRMEPGPGGAIENPGVFATLHGPDGSETGPLRLARVDDEARWYVRDTLFTQAGTWHVDVLVQGLDYFEEFDFLLRVEA